MSRRRPSPIYLLAGGSGPRRTKGDPLLARVLASGPVPNPSVAYVGAASDDDRSFFSMNEYSMQACGARQVIFAPMVSEWVKMERTRAILESADMVFISGGDAEAGMEVLEERGILPLLRELYQAGKPFFGLSAGSIMLARQWVRWEDPDDDATASLFPCMGLAPLVCDTHSEGDHWVELKALLRLTPEGTLGYGIPSGAGLCIAPDGTVEAMGDAAHRYAKKAGKVVQIADLPPQSPRG
jgi:cyanophycinase-like exopeptidase